MLLKVFRFEVVETHNVRPEVYLQNNNFNKQVSHQLINLSAKPHLESQIRYQDESIESVVAVVSVRMDIRYFHRHPVCLR